VVRTTSRVGDRDTITEREQVVGADGRLAPTRETQSEVVRAGSVVRTSAETYGFGSSGERYLRETRDSVENASAGGRVDRADTIRRIDLDGRPTIREYTTEVTSTTAAGRRIERTVQRPDPDGRLRPQTRTEHAEQPVGADGVRTTSTELVADPESRWHVVEVRDRDERRTGSTVEAEETVRRSDLNGRLSQQERHVSRLRVAANGQEELVVETFTDEGGLYQSRSAARDVLSQRIRRTTIPDGNGGRQVVEEVEQRSLVAIDDPLRVVRRVVATVRPTGTGRWRTERRVFERDLNNRLVPTVVETGESTEP
jgi:hypothetical protein